MISVLLQTAATGIAGATKLKVNAAERVNESGLVKAYQGQTRRGIDDKNAPAFDLVVSGTARATISNLGSCTRDFAQIYVPAYLLYYGSEDISAVINSALFALGKTYVADDDQKTKVSFSEDIRIIFNYAEVWRSISGISQVKGGSAYLPDEPIYADKVNLILFNFELKAEYTLNNCDLLC